MSFDVLIGKVQKITKIPNGQSTVIDLFVGNMKSNKEEPDNFIYCKVFFNNTNKSLQNINEKELIEVVGKLQSKKSKSGFNELIFNAFQAILINSNSHPELGMFPSKSMKVFITGVFQNRSGGYEISCKNDGPSTPFIKDGEVKYANDDRNFKINVPSKSKAFATINRELAALTNKNADKQKQFDQNDLDSLKRQKAYIELGFVTAKSVPAELNGIKASNTYLNLNADKLILTQSLNTDASNKSKSDDVPFGKPDFDEDGIDQRYPEGSF